MQGKTVLCVDDSATIRRIIVTFLKNQGCKDIMQASDGLKAIAKMEEKKPDLIISDWNMPNLNGLEFLKIVRGTDEYKDIPFLMLTAEAQKKNVMEAVQAGVSNYVIKPFTDDELRKKVKMTLS
ncbi:MAG: response regulator [Desulfobacterales bacterium]|nr:response regulator [Desulfobacterales bacterium]MCP4163185.1 response regulator [Deltaproteobacteria bacterium]